jgi:hypothetical protein
MKTVQILEPDDCVSPDDLCPLRLESMSGGHSDAYSFTKGDVLQKVIDQDLRERLLRASKEDSDSFIWYDSTPCILELQSCTVDCAMPVTLDQINQTPQSNELTESNRP